MTQDTAELRCRLAGAGHVAQSLQHLRPQGVEPSAHVLFQFVQTDRIRILGTIYPGLQQSPKLLRLVNDLLFARHGIIYVASFFTGDVFGLKLHYITG